MGTQGPRILLLLPSPRSLLNVGKASTLQVYIFAAPWGSRIEHQSPSKFSAMMYFLNHLDPMQYIDGCESCCQNHPDMNIQQNGSGLRHCKVCK